jgi:hypothetical protein
MSSEGYPQLQILNGTNPMRMCAGGVTRLMCSWPVDNRPVTHWEINLKQMAFVSIKDLEDHSVDTNVSSGLSILTVTVSPNASSIFTYRCVSHGDDAPYYSNLISITVQECGPEVTVTPTAPPEVKTDSGSFPVTVSPALVICLFIIEVLGCVW